MKHYKMQYTYVGIDSHKETHTAVFIDCFYDKLGEIVVDNLPSKFEKFLDDAQKLQQDGTSLLFGMEDVSAYGRLLAVFLKANNQQVKHVNPLLVSWERKNQTATQKNDSIDAECAARILLSKLDELPDADPKDKYWILRTLVVRRNFVMRNNISLKNHLHTLLMSHYPSYRSFFYNIDGATALAFFNRYPSPSTLVGTTVDELTEFLQEPSHGKVGAAKALEILGGLQDTTVPFQEMRDTAVRSTIGQIKYNLEELKHLESSLAEVLTLFETTLMSMNGIDVVSAAQLLSNIGDIKRFSTPAKLARYAGIAPIEYSSGKKDLLFANKRGNRELNSLFFTLANRLVMTMGHNNKVMNPFFYEYYHRKISEGKTKRQALKCVQRRLVNIIWTMLVHNEEYVNPPSYYISEEKSEEKA